MNKHVVAGAILLASVFAQSAVAASPKAAAKSDWSGYYVGVMAGSIAPGLKITDAGYNSKTFVTGGVVGQSVHVNNLTFQTGAVAGWNHQFRFAVVGAEGGLGWMDLNGTKLDPGTSSKTYVGLDSGLVGNIDGRIGKPVKKALIYGKAGWSFYNGGYLFKTATAITSKSALSTYQGYNVGAGIEYRLASKLSVKAEYAYSDYGTQTMKQNLYPFKENLSTTALTAGVNYRFLGSHKAAKSKKH